MRGNKVVGKRGKEGGGQEKRGKEEDRRMG